jgi:hypothetical protein
VFGMTRNSPAARSCADRWRPCSSARIPLLTEGSGTGSTTGTCPIGARGHLHARPERGRHRAWDLKGQAAGLPIWQLLGGAEGAGSVAVAAAIPASDRTMDGPRTRARGLRGAWFRSDQDRGRRAPRRTPRG